MAARILAHVSTGRARVGLNNLTGRIWSHTKTYVSMNLQFQMSSRSPFAVAMDKVSYPRMSPDQAIFEDQSEEYAAIATDIALSDHEANRQAMTASERLASLVRDRNWKAAEALRRELIRLNHPIELDEVYKHAALHALFSAADYQEPAVAFSDWFMLIPEARDRRNSLNHFLQKLFYDTHNLNLPVIMRFGLISASKGYIYGNTPIQVIGHVVRYCLPSASEQYLRLYEDCAVLYKDSKRVPIKPSFWSRIYTLALRTQISAGRLDAAVRLLDLASGRNHQVSDLMLSALVKKLQKIPDTTAIAKVKELYPIFFDRLPTTSFLQQPLPSTLDMLLDSRDMVASLRYIRKAIISDSQPTPFALLAFVTNYRAMGRHRAISLLRSKAYRHRSKALPLWIMMEMLYHRKRNELRTLLLVFANHFHLIGVPRKSILSRIRVSSAMIKSQTDKRRSFPRLASPHHAMREKLWPTAYHTALAWDALVWLTPSRGHHRLYSHLLKTAQSSLTQTPLSDGVDGQPSLMMLPNHAIDTVHFTPFIKAFVKRRKLAPAAGILRDMLELGIQPSIHHWSMIARGYAQFGLPERAMLILDRMESESSVTLVAGEDQHHVVEDPRDISREDTPLEDDIAVYTNVLRGFVLARRLEYALLVRQKIETRFRYVEGTRQATDRAFRFCDRLQTELNTSEQQLKRHKKRTDMLSR